MATFVAAPAGRLVTFRLRAPIDNSAAGKGAAELREVIRLAPGPALVCADVTASVTLSPETADIYVRAMRADNPKVERSALLIGRHSATFALQIERMIREAGNPARRVFRNPADVAEWLQPLLTAAERVALQEFLDAVETD